MPFHHTSGVATNLADLITKLKDALIAGGWTLYDDQWAGSSYYIMYSNGGEEGLVPFYMELKQIGTIVMEPAGYLDHPGGGGAGLGRFGAGSNLYLNIGIDASLSYWITCDKNGYILATQQSTTNRIQEFSIGYPYLGINGDGSLQIAVTSSPVTAGGGVVISVDDASFFQANNKYIIREGDTLEKITLSAVGPGNQITATSLANSYGAGAFVGRQPVPAVISRQDFGLQWYEAVTALASVHASGISHQCTRGQHPALLYSGPDRMSGLNHLYPVFVYNPVSAYQGMRMWNRFGRMYGTPIAQGDTMPIGTQTWVGVKAGTVYVFMRQS